MKPTIVTVPCFSGAPWDLDKLTPLSDWSRQTMRLPERLETIDDYADFVAQQVASLDEYVLVGDSFGAIVSLALAVRQPAGLKALVMSGGFAADPVTNPWIKFRKHLIPFLRGELYRQITLRFHAQTLASPFDLGGQVPLSIVDARSIFLENTSDISYISRLKAAFSANYIDRLSRVQVPTLILTPGYERLIGEHAAKQMLAGIPDAVEVILPNAGHMFRFTHPVTYAAAIRSFLQTRIAAPSIAA